MKKQRWIPSLIIAAVIAGTAGLCQAQNITYDFNSGLESWVDYSGNPSNTVSWNMTGGPDGSGCAEYTFANLTNGVPDGFEVDPGVAVAFNPASYATVDVDIKCSGGKTGTGGSGGYGNLQFVWRNAGPSGWNSAWYGAVLNSGWQHYRFAMPAGSGTAGNIQFQLQGNSGTGYNAPVTVDVDNLVIAPLANPFILEAFTDNSWVWQNYGASGALDTAQDAPYFNPVNGAGPSSITPAGSMEFQAPNPSGYNGGQLNLSFNPSLYQWVGFDVYYDGPTPADTNDYAGFQFFIANGASPYNWVNVGNHSFTAADIGTWKHYNFPCASSGLVNGAGFAIQATPGATGGHNPITLHWDNFQLWNPATHPQIAGLTRSNPGGVQITLDGNGTANLNDQEGICSPSVDNGQTNFFWINQFPASYSMSLTNMPNPTNAPSFDAHIYVWNGDTIATAFTGAFGYNQTYSGAIYNVPDAISFDVQNGTNGGVVASLGWKTNLFNSNISNNNVTTFIFPSMASANGTWTLGFINNTDGYILAPDNSSNSITLPDFSAAGNFTPLTSAVSVGVFKNGNVLNDGQSAIFTHIGVNNTSGGNPLVNYNESFPGPGLTGDMAWQVAEYYQYAADRVVWIPQNVAWWITWNTTASGWTVQSAPDLSTWASGLVTYTYVDATGTNTVGAIPAAGLPDVDFFRLIHP